MSEPLAIVEPGQAGICTAVEPLMAAPRQVHFSGPIPQIVNIGTHVCGCVVPFVAGIQGKLWKRCKQHENDREWH